MSFHAELVRALQEDGRASIHSLAERLGCSRALVSTRLREILTDSQVRVVAAVDPAFLGQHVIAHVALRVVGEVDGVAGQLRELRESVLVSVVGGAHDVVAEVRVGSMAELHATVVTIRSLPGVAAVSTLVYTTVVKGFFVSDYRGTVTVDDTDVAIIQLLQRDGRATYRAIGESVRLSPSAVTTRVQRLVDGGVIKISAVEARGLAQRQLAMGIGLNMRGGDDRLVEELRSSRGVDFAARTVGRFDLVATLVEPTAAALHESLERVRAHPEVEHVESWLHLAVLKEDYTRRLRLAR